MRFLPSLFIFVIALTGRLSAQGNSDPITVTGTIPDKSIVQPVAPLAIDLRNHFAVPSITGQVVQFTTAGVGTFNVEMKATEAPLTVANFLAYVNANRLANTLVHRSDKPLGVIQGGGYIPNTTGTTFTAYNFVQKNTPITLETSDTLPNVRGAIAMARSGYSSTSSGTATVTSSSATSRTVTLTSAPGGFGVGWGLLGSFVQSISGTTVTLAANANQTIASSTSVPTSNTITVTNSSTASKTVSVNAASLPPGFGPAWGFLGSFVQSVSGSTVTLTANANQAITSPTSVAWSNQTGTSEWFINTVDNTFTLPPANSGGYAAFGRVTGTGMSVVDTIAGLPVLAGDITVTQSSTGSSLLTVNSATLPANFGVGWVLLGQQVQNVIGSFVYLTGNADTDINSPTTVHYGLFQDPFFQLPVFHNLASFGSGNINLSELVKMTSITAVPIFPATPTGPSVVKFSATSSNPGIVNVSVSGSNLYIAAAANLTTTSPVTITVTATDSNANSVQSQFNVSVTRRVQDYNSDGNADLLLQNTAGQIAVWRLNGNGGLTSTSYLSANNMGDWRLATTADMNADGTSDLIFQNTAGQIALWFMNSNGTMAGSGVLVASALGDWRLVGVADTNRDGNPDLVLQNTAGQIAVWYLNASRSVIGTGYISTGALGDWRVGALADINGDGRADVVFQNGAGQVAVWYLNGAGAPSGTAFISAGSLGDWKISAASDMNGDGKADLLFQNTAGQIAVWYLNGSGAISGSGVLYGGGLGDWRVQ